MFFPRYSAAINSFDGSSVVGGSVLPSASEQILGSILECTRHITVPQNLSVAAELPNLTRFYDCSRKSALCVLCSVNSSVCACVSETFLMSILVTVLTAG